jgi:hypothetical protein
VIAADTAWFGTVAPGEVRTQTLTFSPLSGQTPAQVRLVSIGGARVPYNSLEGIRVEPEPVFVDGIKSIRITVGPYFKETIIRGTIKVTAGSADGTIKVYADVFRRPAAETVAGYRRSAEGLIAEGSSELARRIGRVAGLTSHLEMFEGYLQGGAGFSDREGEGSLFKGISDNDDLASFAALLRHIDVNGEHRLRQYRGADQEELLLGAGARD